MLAFIRRIVDLAVVVKPAIRYKSYRATTNLHHHINMSDAEKRQALEDLLKANSIEYDVVEHPAVYTVDEMMPYLTNIKGALCKNLFLKDKKKKFYLLSAVHDAEVKLGDIGKSVGAPGGLRLADEAFLTEKLGVTQGAVTALSLHNDKDKSVRFLCDKRLLDSTYEAVNFHPMVNTATLTLKPEDFKKYLQITEHDATAVELSSPQ